MFKMLRRNVVSRREKMLRKSSGANVRRLATAVVTLLVTLFGGTSIAGASGGVVPSGGTQLGSLQTLRNTIEMLMTLLSGVGLCFLAFGTVSLAMSFQSHDDSQKSKAILAIIGGAIAASARYIVPIIAPQASGWM